MLTVSPSAVQEGLRRAETGMKGQQRRTAISNRHLTSYRPNRPGEGMPGHCGRLARGLIHFGNYR